MSDAFPHRAIASRGGVRWTEEVPEGVGLAEDSQTEDSPDSQPDGSVLRLITVVDATARVGVGARALARAGPTRSSRRG